jgi:hypothetical protein
LWDEVGSEGVRQHRECLELLVNPLPAHPDVRPYDGVPPLLAAGAHSVLLRVITRTVARETPRRFGHAPLTALVGRSLCDCEAAWEALDPGARSREEAVWTPLLACLDAIAGRARGGALSVDQCECLNHLYDLGDRLTRPREALELDDSGQTVEGIAVRSLPRWHERALAGCARLLLYLDRATKAGLCLSPCAAGECRRLYYRKRSGQKFCCTYCAQYGAEARDH